jgi:pilus assembly protein CpaF
MHIQSLPVHILRRQIADSLDVIVHMSRMPDGSRKIVDIAEVLSAGNDKLKTQSIFSYHVDGLDTETGKATGQFEPGGVCPTFLSKLAIMDIHLPREMFV